MRQTNTVISFNTFCNIKYHTNRWLVPVTSRLLATANHRKTIWSKNGLPQTKPLNGHKICVQCSSAQVHIVLHGYTQWHNKGCMMVKTRLIDWLHVLDVFTLMVYWPIATNGYTATPFIGAMCGYFLGPPISYLWGGEGETMALSPK